jgi:hypothetical protein
MARVMEKSGARRVSAAQARSVARAKPKAARPAPVAAKSAAASKVIKVVPKVVPAGKKDRASMRPGAVVVAAQRGGTPVAAVARVEAVRVNGSEHGAAVSRTDHLKARFAALSSASAQIKALKRSLQKSFLDVGALLAKIRDEKLYEVKGYGSFESFVEREVDLDKMQCLRLAKASRLFIREAALELGLERITAAMAALDGDTAGGPSAVVYPVSATVSSALPAHKR